MHHIPFSCTNSPCNLLFLNLGVCGLVKATVCVGTVLIWHFAVARVGGGGYLVCRSRCWYALFSINALGLVLTTLGYLRTVDMVVASLCSLWVKFVPPAPVLKFCPFILSTCFTVRKERAYIPGTTRCQFFFPQCGSAHGGAQEPTLGSLPFFFWLGGTVQEALAGHTATLLIPGQRVLARCLWFEFCFILFLILSRHAPLLWRLVVPRVTNAALSDWMMYRNYCRFIFLFDSDGLCVSRHLSVFPPLLCNPVTLVLFCFPSFRSSEGLVLLSAFRGCAFFFLLSALFSSLYPIWFNAC